MIPLSPLARLRRGGPFSGGSEGIRPASSGEGIRPGRVRHRSPVELNLDHDGDGLRVRQAGEQRQVSLGQARAGVGLGSGEGHTRTGRSGLRVSIPDEILAARARARVPGEWSRAPVIGGGSGWHAIKIQARLALRTIRRVAPK